MKSKKLYKTWKSGEEFKNGILYCVKGLRKRMTHKRTCRFRKHKIRIED